MAIGTGKIVRRPWMTSKPNSAGMPSRLPSTASRCSRLICDGIGHEQQRARRPPRPAPPPPREAGLRRRPPAPTRPTLPQAGGSRSTGSADRPSPRVSSDAGARRLVPGCPPCRHRRAPGIRPVLIGRSRAHSVPASFVGASGWADHVDPRRFLEGRRDGVHTGGHHPGRDGHGGADVDDGDAVQVVDQAERREEDEQQDDSCDDRQALEDEEQQRVAGDGPAGASGQIVAAWVRRRRRSRRRRLRSSRIVRRSP